MKAKAIVQSTLLLLVFASALTLFGSAYALELTPAERKALEAELAIIEAEISANNKLLTSKKAETQSLERDVAILNAEIEQAQLNIRRKNLLIGELGEEISLRSQTIGELTDKIAREKDSLAELIRKRQLIDDQSLAVIVLSNKNFSEFFTDLDRFQEVKLQLRASMNEIRTVKGVAEEERTQLDSQRAAETDAAKEIEVQKQQVEIKEAQKSQLVSISKTEERAYETVIARKQAQAAQIRAALFQLRGAGPIPFGDALDYANEASGKTGVRPALILAILQQESALGANVGTCNRPSDTLKWQDIMPGPGESWRDDQAAYLRITKKLGIDPEGQPLSCPIGGGWGGAMGPSQFIPTTWEGYESQIASLVGASVANPWNPRHAVHATALYMRDLGAGAGGYTAERTAALKYYAGGNWSLPQNAFYGDGVVSKADTIQVCQIDVIEDGADRPSWCPAI